MTPIDDARNSLDRLMFEELDDPERKRMGAIVADYVDDVGGENHTLEMSWRHEKSEHDRWFAEADRLSKELHTMRGDADKCRGEVVAMADAAGRLCVLLESDLCNSEVPMAVAELRSAMRGEKTRQFSKRLDESIRRFEALHVIERMLYKLRLDETIYQKARDWAVKQLHP